MFVEDRFRHTPAGENTQRTNKARKSPRGGTCRKVAYSAKGGNAIGAITDLKTPCLAAGRPDLANRCAVELQKALDQLKWGVEPNQEEIGKIRQEVGTAPWLKLKRIRRVSRSSAPDSDSPQRTGSAHSTITSGRNCTSSLPIKSATAGGLPWRDLRRYLRPRHAEGSGRDFDGVRREHRLDRRETPRLRRCRTGSSVEAGSPSRISKASASKEAANERRALVRKRNQAQAALHFYEERSRQDLRNLINIVRKWAERKEGHALDWLAALWDIACKSRRWDQRENRRLNTGSIAFYAFPQYLVDMIVERTGGRPITVALPSLVDGEVSIDEAGSVYLVDESVRWLPGSLVRRQTLLLQVMGDGRLITDNGRTYHVRPFAVQPGQAQVRNGRLELPNTQQRPGIPILKGN